jgi:flavin-dependent dehydrogenase
MEPSYDVLICGAGLAGLTLARQVKLELPELSVAVVDRVTGPVPEAAHKVGESSNELASHYFRETLGLGDYLTRRQLPKFSLRFFFGDAHGPLEDRPELGPSLSAPFTTYQLDRGRLENDLRQMAAEMGVEVIEGTIVDAIELRDGVGQHEVRCRRRNGSQSFTLCGRWVIDALGRRRLLASKLNLRLPSSHTGSAAWWRINARVDIADMATNHSKQWQRRTVEDRYLSTNHLMGRGYWVWLIPLASGATSIGIVTDEEIHPFTTYGRSYEQALGWLRGHEPAVWRLIKGSEPLDFRGLKNYSYNARQIFSRHRWSCVGDAGVFLDPLYSPGSDFIAIENTITVEMIRQDFAGELTQASVDNFNRLVLDFLAPDALAYYKSAYLTSGHAHIFVAKLAWDVATYWAILSQIFFQGVIRRPIQELFDLLLTYKKLNARVQQIFIDWAEVAPPRAPFIHADLTRMRFLQMLYVELAAKRSDDQFLERARRNVERLDELAQVLFRQAVEECIPEQVLAHFQLPQNINPWGMSLDPARWEADGLYEPRTVRPLPRQLRDMYAGIFAPMSRRQFMQVEVPYRIWKIGRGRLVPPVVGFLLRRLVCDKPAMWLRRLFIAEPTSLPATEERPATKRVD